MRTAEVRAELDLVGRQVTQLGRKIRKLTEELHKRKPLKKAKPWNHMTPEKKKRIKELWRQNIPQNRIAEIVKVNQGRVSEVIRGKRT